MSGLDRTLAALSFGALSIGALSIGALSLGLLGCAPDLEDPERFQDLDCNYDVPTQLLAPRCGTEGCHSAFEPVQGMDLMSGNVAERLVGIESTTCLGHMRIDPANPSASFLLERVSPDPDCDGTAVSPMPQVGTPLSEDEVACLTAWIEEVAAEYADRMGGAPRDGGPGGSDAGPDTDAGPEDGG